MKPFEMLLVAIITFILGMVACQPALAAYTCRLVHIPIRDEDGKVIGYKPDYECTPDPKPSCDPEENYCPRK